MMAESLRHFVDCQNQTHCPPVCDPISKRWRKRMQLFSDISWLTGLSVPVAIKRRDGN
jgi:hypothetical protein